jgi:hypothetical protein
MAVLGHPYSMLDTTTQEAVALVFVAAFAVSSYLSE